MGAAMEKSDIRRSCRHLYGASKMNSIGQALDRLDSLVKDESVGGGGLEVGVDAAVSAPPTVAAQDTEWEFRLNFQVSLQFPGKDITGKLQVDVPLAEGIHFWGGVPEVQAARVPESVLDGFLQSDVTVGGPKVG